MIHVCLCFRDETGRYAKFAGTTMLSVFENTQAKITVHILHDNTLTADNRDKFSYLAGRYGRLVKFYNLDELCPDKIAKIIELVPDVKKSRVTVGTFYKLLIPQVLPKNIDKAIFLDPDTLVNLDLSELWQTELEDKALAVVTEAANGSNTKKTFLLCSDGVVKNEDYFNGGVLVMNLKVLRDEEEMIMQGIKFRGENPKQKFLEQTVLNYCFSERTFKLPVKFNRFVRYERRDERPLERKIYHFAGAASSVGIETNDPFNKLWINCFIKTPFFDEASIGRLHAIFQKYHDGARENALKIAAAVPSKARAFLIDPKSKDAMKKFFSIQKREKIILAEKEFSVEELIATMKADKGKSVFFITTANIAKKKFPVEQLTNAGFKENEDFIKAWELLTDAHGATFDTHNLIQAL